MALFVSGLAGSELLGVSAPTGLSFASGGPAKTKSLLVADLDGDGDLDVVTESHGGAFYLNANNQVGDLAPAIQVHPQDTHEISESAVDATVGQFIPTDPDDPDGNDNYIFELVTGEGDTDNHRFSINSTGQLIIGQALPTSPLSVRVKVTDSGGLSYSSAFGLQVANVSQSSDPEPQLAPDSLADKLIEFSLFTEDGSIIGERVDFHLAADGTAWAGFSGRVNWREPWSYQKAGNKIGKLALSTDAQGEHYEIELHFTSQTEGWFWTYEYELENGVLEKEFDFYGTFKFGAGSLVIDPAWEFSDDFAKDFIDSDLWNVEREDKRLDIVQADGRLNFILDKATEDPWIDATSSRLLPLNEDWTVQTKVFANNDLASGYWYQVGLDLETYRFEETDREFHIELSKQGVRAVVVPDDDDWNTAIYSASVEQGIEEAYLRIRHVAAERTLYGEYDPDGAENGWDWVTLLTFNLETGAGTKLSNPTSGSLDSFQSTPWGVVGQPSEYLGLGLDGGVDNVDAASGDLGFDEIIVIKGSVPDDVGLSPTDGGAAYQYNFDVPDTGAVSYAPVTMPSWLSLTQGDPIVTTLAGSGSQGSTDATGAAASFNEPTGIVTDGTYLYVVDAQNHKIRKVEIATGVVTTLAGSSSHGSTDGTGATASFNVPKGITIVGGYLYVADYGSQKIRKVEIATGVVTTLAGSGSSGSTDDTGAAASFNYPQGITTDGTYLYVADTFNQKIRKVEIATGVVTTLAGSGSPGSTDGTGAAASFSGPKGITTDGTYLYVAESGNHKIRKVEIATGVVTTLAGSGSYGSTDGTGAAASFSSPEGITAVGGYLYVADTQSFKIRKVEIATGVVTTLAGSGSYGASDGFGPYASFSGAIGLAADGAYLFVTDKWAYNIRKINVANYFLSGSPTDADLGDHTITLTATDSQGGTTTESFVVNVPVATKQFPVSPINAISTNPVPELPPMTVVMSDFALLDGGNSITIMEDQGPGAVVGEFHVVTPSGGIIQSLELVDGEGASGNAYFDVEGNKLQLGLNFDHSTQAQYSVRLKATDSSNFSLEKVFAISSTAWIRITDPPDELGELTAVGSTFIGIVRTEAMSGIEAREALAAGEVLADGGASITETGFVVSEKYFFGFDDPGTLRFPSTHLSLGTFKVRLTGLNPGTRYYCRAYVVNSEGVSLGAKKRFNTSLDVNNPWKSAIPLGNGWFEVPWLGPLYQTDNGWCHHQELGWFYATADNSSNEGVWMWSRVTGWLWTSPSTFPYLWEHNTADWLYFLGRDHTFFSFQLRAWVKK